MKQSRKINIPIYPTKTQEKILNDFAWQAKKVWNTTLSHYKWLSDQRRKDIANGISKKDVRGIKSKLNKEVYDWWVKEKLNNGNTVWEEFSIVQNQRQNTILPSSARNAIVGSSSSNTGAIYKAYIEFLRGTRKPPKFKGLQSNPPELLLIAQDSAFRIYDINENWGEITLSGVGRVKFRNTDRFREWNEVRNKKRATFGKGTVTKKHGKWILSLTFSTEIKNFFKKRNHKFQQKEIGVDLGATIPVALSNGEVLGVSKPNLDSINAKNPWNKNDWKSFSGKIINIKRKLSRFETRRQEEAKVKLGINKPNNKLSPSEWGKIKQIKLSPSRQEKKLRLKKQNLERRLDNKKKEMRHQISNIVAGKAKKIYIEDLKLSNMTKSAKGTRQVPGKNVKAKSGLNRATLDNGLADIVTKLKYKAEDYESEICEVAPQNTSRTCINCGFSHKNNRKQEVFNCLACSYQEHADVHASKNVLAKGRAPEIWEKKRQKAIKRLENKLTTKSSQSIL